MKNVLDIKREKNLNCILPTNDLLGEISMEQHKVLVIIHLYYQDTVAEYVDFVKNIPEEVDIIFTVSNDDMRTLLAGYISSVRKNYEFVKKENRGRDISAFLVACRERILEYEYVCFVHDKKEKDEVNCEDNKQWVNCLWENTIGSSKYIRNIIYTFSKKENIGVLVPPPPLSSHYTTACRNSWTNNYEGMKELAGQLGLICDLDKEKSPITIGTAFWVKVSAVRKLFERKWQYTDFPPEPLANDGTISHVIERSFAYISQDAGFDTGWVMTDRFASERMEYMNYIMGKMCAILEEHLHVYTVEGVETLESDMEKLRDFASRNNTIYIYGAGKVAKAYRNRLCALDRFPDLYIVSERKDNPEYIGGVPIVQIEDVDFSNKPGIIVGVGKKNKEEVLLRLKNVVGQNYENIL